MPSIRPILISNSFPFSLVRRPVNVRPRQIDELADALRSRPFASAWGHANTVAVASEIAGVDLTPATERPALTLSDDLLPVLDGRSFDECWLLSPDYTPGFRPQPNQEVSPDHIHGWQVLHLHWPPADFPVKAVENA